MKKSRAIMIISLVMLVVFALPIIASAETTAQSYKDGSHTFKKAWGESKTKYFRDAKCVLTYGYNTALINEDYANAYTVGSVHRSRIQNANGWHNGPWKVANEWSDKEVRHKGTSIVYRQTWK